MTGVAVYISSKEPHVVNIPTPQSLNEWWSRLTGKPAPSLDAQVDREVADERVRREQKLPVEPKPYAA